MDASSVAAFVATIVSLFALFRFTRNGSGWRVVYYSVFGAAAVYIDAPWWVLALYIVNIVTFTHEWLKIDPDKVSR